MKLHDKISLLSTAVPLIAIAACTIGPDVKDGTAITTNADLKGPKLCITVERGPAWITNAEMGPMHLKIRPQMAFWIEDTSGAFLADLFVTNCFGKQQWKMVKAHPDSCYRPTCMPYWMNLREKTGAKRPTKNAPLPDAVTAATPAGSFTITTMLPAGLTRFALCAELNSSFDNNDFYTRKRPNWFNGQPSVVFKTTVDLTDTSATSWTLAFAGHGGETGDDTNLYPPDDPNITTAKQIVRAIVVKRL